MKLTKNYKNALSMIEKGKKYTAVEACELAKKTTTVKYDATIRVSFKLNVDPRQADQQMDVVCNFRCTLSDTGGRLSLDNSKRI